MICVLWLLFYVLRFAVVRFGVFVFVAALSLLRKLRLAGGHLAGILSFGLGLVIHTSSSSTEISNGAPQFLSFFQNDFFLVLMSILLCYLFPQPSVPAEPHAKNSESSPTSPIDWRIDRGSRKWRQKLQASKFFNGPTLPLIYEIFYFKEK